MLFIQTLILCFLMAITLAHPGHNVAEEAAERADYFKRSPKSLSKCATNLQVRAFEDIDRRHNLANDLRTARGLAKLEARNFAAYNFSHLVPDPGSNVLAQDSSCILQPDGTAGPYLVTGEAFRSNVTNGQEGVPLTLEIRIVDTSTCGPLPGIYLDLWHTNANGVYSSLQADSNGNSEDTSNVDNTAFRGVQTTDSDGTVKFSTLFPGHYTGRANHIHIITHNPSFTFLEVTGPNHDPYYIYNATHVGQLFFDQNLISEVEALEPYTSNQQAPTQNSADLYLTQEATSSDPFVSYTLLGDALADGILAWTTIGIDTTEDAAVKTPFYLSPG